MANYTVHLIFYLLVLYSTKSLSYVPPTFTMERISNKPIISSWDRNSEFLYNYNVAYMPANDASNTVTLLVRVQDLLNDSKTIYDVGPSKIAISQSLDSTYLRYSNVTHGDIIIDNDTPDQSIGAEDPRVVFYEGTYYLFYTAVSKPASDWRAQLALATCNNDCLKKANWVLRGPLFPSIFWCKSGSLLIHNSTHRYLFFNDSNIAIARTNDLLHYELTHDFLLRTRSNFFDSDLVEAGPEPLKLSDNNYLFLYNSARKTNISNPKPGWALQYNLGWAILSGDDPTKVLARSDQPIFSPELDWEKCDNTSGAWAERGLTPLVIFIEGWKKTAENTFLVWYQGCDSTTGLAKLTVNFQQSSRATIIAPILIYFLIFLQFCTFFL